MGHAYLDPRVRFADFGRSASLDHLRIALAHDLIELGVNDIDLSVVTGPHRPLTQRCARYTYDRMDEAGEPLFAGIRYLARYGTEHECWAIFGDRIEQHGAYVETGIPADDEALLSVAGQNGMTIEVIPGQSYLRPWQT